VSKSGEEQSLLDIMMRYNHVDASKEDKRLIAVTAALELIRCDATGGNADVGDELKNIGRYADFIQKAMKPEK